MMDINVDLLFQWFINFSMKKTSGGAVESEITLNQLLAEELHKPIFRKFEN